MSAPIKTAMVNGAASADSTTDIVVSTTTSLVYDDVRVFDDYYTQLCGFQTAWGNYVATGTWGGVIGMARCELKHAAGTAFANRCDRHYLYFDESTKDVLTTAQLKANAVHELGHALGLNHNSSTDSVMKQNNLGVSTFNTHDKGHINAAF